MSGASTGLAPTVGKVRTRASSRTGRNNLWDPGFLFVLQAVSWGSTEQQLLLLGGAVQQQLLPPFAPSLAPTACVAAQGAVRAGELWWFLHSQQLAPLGDCLLCLSLELVLILLNSLGRAPAASLAPALQR